MLNFRYSKIYYLLFVYTFCFHSRQFHIYILFRMGIQICKNSHQVHQLSNQSYAQQRLDNQLALSQNLEPDFFQQYDNPSRILFDQNFLKTTVSASHNKMVLKKSKSLKPTFILKSSSNEISSQINNGKICLRSARSTKSNSAFIQSQDESHVSIDKKSMRRASIQLNVSIDSKEDDESFKNKEEIMKSISGYILTQKNMAQPLKFAKQQFIPIKNQDIKLHYDFKDKIGEGSFGRVYRIVNKITQEIRAVKKLKKSQNHKIQNKRKTSEIDILKAVDHPNIIKIYEVYFWHERYYIITEFCQGGSLLKYIKQSKPFTMLSLKIIFRKIFSALKYIHKLNIIHRDIKSQNIIFVKNVGINQDINDLDVRIIDFGLSKYLAHETIKDRERIGTCTYMAPEVINGVYSTKCDIWSAGVLLYSLICGYNPFKGQTKEQTIENICHTHSLFQGSRWKDVDYKTKDFILKTLTKNNSERYSAEQCLNHPFLKFEQAASETQLIDEVTKKFNEYHRGDNLVTAMQYFISFTSSSKMNSNKFAKMFQLLDKNCDGFIAKEELKMAFEKSSHSYSQSEVQYMLCKMDKYHSGKIHFSEFVAILSDRKQLFEPKQLIKAFNSLDVDKSGYLQKNELQNMLKIQNESEIDNILTNVGQNDQRISQDEFIKYLQESNNS